jgi:hypothetical protein
MLDTHNSEREQLTPRPITSCPRAFPVILWSVR